MTHIGLVAMVLLAPAMTEEQRFTGKSCSNNSCQLRVLRDGAEKGTEARAWLWDDNIL